jgi:hypothetical protein
LQKVHRLKAAWEQQAVELANIHRDADEAEHTTSYYLDQLLVNGQEIEGKSAMDSAGGRMRHTSRLMGSYLRPGRTGS